ncbi:MAG: LLM class F420-dependent oxidoreductase [Chloroflexi bacterium]|nr:LLM class F420-dependent oxidoreductase [Chloroflexota bacterium]
MRFGIMLRNINPMPVAEARNYFLEYVRMGEELGYELAWLADHILSIDNSNSSYPYNREGRFVYSDPQNAYWEPLTVMAALSAVTTRIRFATGVLVLPLRHPIYTAKVVATVDCLSNGRVVLGVGPGWLKEEMQLLGAPTTERHGALTDEHIRIFKELWTKDSPHFEGTWYRFSGFTFTPKPVQKPHPPIWVGGISEAALRRTARLGNGWRSPGQTVDKERASIERLRQLCAAEGRPFHELALSTSVRLVIDKDAKGGGEAEFSYVGDSISPTYRGNPDQLARSLKRYQDIGIGHLCGHYAVQGGKPGPAGSIQAAEILAKEVIPQVARA